MSRERVSSRRLPNSGQGTKALTPARVARYSVGAQSSSDTSRMGNSFPWRTWAATSSTGISSSSWPRSMAQGIRSSYRASVR